MTGDLERRLHERPHEHESKGVSGLTSRYNVTRLVHLEEYPTAAQAIAREKAGEAVEGVARVKKRALIEAANPG